MRNKLRCLRTGGILIVAGVLSAAALSRTPSGAPSNTEAAGHLRDTGLYSDFATRTIDPRNLAYTPQYPLWSDGATKRRWIFIPPGTTIDATDPNVWTFPAGTKVWKEFSFHGRPVETRLIEHLDNDVWLFAAYVWNADGTDATLVPAAGLRDVVEIIPGKRHDIPSVNDCRDCHVSNRTELLGFSALQLSSDRDPNAPHAETVRPGMINLTTLIQRDLIVSYPTDWKHEPPTIASRSPTERAALGYMHSNCGNCHNSESTIQGLGLVLRHDVTPGARVEPAIATTLSRTGRFRIPGTTNGDTLIVPGDPEHSAVFFRMASREQLYQMPPLGTKLADADAVALVRRWIEDMGGNK